MPKASTSPTWRNRLRSLWRKYVRSRWQDYEWPVIWGLGLAALVLGYRGFDKYFAGPKETRSPADLFYRTLQLFVLGSGAVDGSIPWELEVARLLAPGVTSYTAAQALAVIFRKQLQLLRVLFFSDHAVVCGLGRKGRLLAETFQAHGYRVVAIDRNQDNSELAHCREQGAIALSGDATDGELLRKARVHRAKYLICVCGDDGTNTEVAVRARELIRGRKGKVLTCMVHIADVALYTLLREQEIEAQPEDSLRLEFFNIYESAARTMLSEHPAFSEIARMADDPVHLLVVGLGHMGESLVVGALRKWRAMYPASDKRLRITIVDKAAELKTESLRLRYPRLLEACDLVPKQMDIHSPEFQRAEFLSDDRGRCSVTAAYVCFDDDARGLSAALALFQWVRAHRVRIPIVVRMLQDAGLATLLRGEDINGGGFENLNVFGLLDRTCKLDLIVGGTHEVLARVIHEDFVRNRQQEGKTLETNPSMAPWDQLPEYLKESNRRQADHIGVKLKAIGCEIAPLTDWEVGSLEFAAEEVERLAEMEHDRWVDERKRDGWQPGPRDAQKKTTPYLVPWDELTEEIKDYDRNTVRGLPLFLAKVGFKIVRVKL